MLQYEKGRNPKICRRLPEFILKISINTIDYPEREKVIKVPKKITSLL